ncbi:MAG: HNH endonuclease signature motif containing protein [Clostridia bacterium]|nr:HNH endonuclease signature motif containing protein [Clostridia bacterium]
MELVKNVSEVSEKSKPEVNKFKEIKTETNITPEETRNFWDKLFSRMEEENDPVKENSNEKSENTVKDVTKENNPVKETSDEELENTVKEYIKDVKDKSEMPDIISDKSFEASDLKKISPEENAKMHEEFVAKRELLISQWEDKHDCLWPTYKEDVIITNKNGKEVTIHSAGDRYDAHHIQPLCLGGKNEVDNITPLRAEVHFDHRGVHATGSPYDKLNKMF